MDTPAVPTMSTAGFLSSPETMLSYLFSCFLASEESQSNLFSINSMPGIIARYSGDNNEVVRQVRESLKSLYEPYFERVVVNVSGQPWQEDDSKWHLAIAVTAFRGGDHYDLRGAVTKDERNRFKFQPM